MPSLLHPLSASAGPSPAAAPDKAGRPRRRGPLVAGGVLLALVAGVAICEWAGWPFLIEPLRGRVENALQRPVTLEGKSSLHLLGGVKLDVDHMRVADADWTGSPAMLDVQDLKLQLRYRDLFAAGRGQGLRVRSLTAHTLSANLARRADGEANWALGPLAAKEPAATPNKPSRLVMDELLVDSFSGQYKDTFLMADATFSGALTAGEQNGTGGLRAQADGHYRKAELHARLSSESPLPMLTEGGQAPPVAVVFKLSTGQVKLDFDGSVSDMLGARNLRGKYQLSGPSLAAVGQPLGLTLPTTEDFTMHGDLVREGPRFRTHVAAARVGRSQMSGDFLFDTSGRRNVLTGALNAGVLWPSDLAPAVGAPNDAATARRQADDKVLPQREFDLPSLKAMDASVDLHILRMPLNKDGSTSITPLNAKLTLDNGNLQLDIDKAQLGDGQIRGRIGLAVSDKPGSAPRKADPSTLAAAREAAASEAAADASAVMGEAAQALATAPLRAPTASDPLGMQTARPEAVSDAHWSTDLRWTGIAIEQVVPTPGSSTTAKPGEDPTTKDKVLRAIKGGEPVKAGTKGPAAPYASGRLAGRIKLDGTGRSTAQILGSATGQAQVLWTRGTVSHLLVEAAGLDLAQSLGRLISGDEPLQVRCGAGSLAFNNGVVKPMPLVIDTHDSTLWVDGEMSLKTEQLGLRALVSPKDGTPISLRSPVRLTGTLASPGFSIEKGPLLEKIVPSVLLAFVNPLAAIIPLIDTGDEKAAQEADLACRNVAERITGKR